MSGSHFSSASTSRWISLSAFMTFSSINRRRYAAFSDRRVSGPLGFRSEVFELRKFHELVFRGSRKRDLAPRFVEGERCIGHGDQTAADAEETTDLENGEKDFVTTDDEVIDRADAVVLVVEDGMTHQLADPIAFPNDSAIDNNDRA